MWFILLRSENHIERSWWLHGNRFDRTEFQIKSTAWLGQTIIWLSWWWWQLILIVWQWKKLRTNFYHWRYHRLWREFSHKHMFLHEKWSQSGHRISRSTGKAEMNKITLQPIHQLRFLLVIQLIFSSLFFFFAFLYSQNCIRPLDSKHPVKLLMRILGSNHSFSILKICSKNWESQQKLPY